MNADIYLIDKMGRTIATQLVVIPFVPDIEETIHLDPTRFKPKIKGYEKDEFLAAKVWSRAMNVPNKAVEIKVLFNSNYGIPKEYL